MHKLLFSYFPRICNLNDLVKTRKFKWTDQTFVHVSLKFVVVCSPAFRQKKNCSPSPECSTTWVLQNNFWFTGHQKSSSVSSLNMTIDFRNLFSSQALTRHLDRDRENEENLRKMALLHQNSALLYTNPSLDWDFRMCLLCAAINKCIYCVIIYCIIVYCIV